MFIENIIKFLIVFIVLGVNSSFASDDDLKVAVPNPITTTDPFFVKTAQDNFILPLVYESLFKRNLDGDLLPLLAKAFNNFGSKKLKVVLNEDIMFSDGSFLKVEDVIESLKKYCKDNKSFIRLSSLKGCGPDSNLDVKKTADNTFELGVLENYLYAVEQLSYPGIGIFKVKNGEKIGSGAFKLESIESNCTKLGINHFHINWKHRKLKFKRINFQFVSEKNIVKALEKKMFHVASMYFENTISKLSENGYAKLVHSENVVSGIVLNKKVFALRELKVRRSLQKIVYEQDFSICNGQKYKNIGMIPEGIGGFVDDSLLKKELSFINFDKIIKVKSQIDVLFYRHIERKNECEENLIKDIFKKHNLNLNIVYIDNYKELFSKYLDHSTDGYIELFVYNSLDALSLLKRLLPKKSTNVFFYTSKNITDFLNNASREKILNQRFEYYRGINMEIAKEAIFLPLGSTSHTNVINKCLISKKTDSQFFNPNSFLYLLELDLSKDCQLEGIDEH